MPRVGRDAFVADTARVIGDVQLGDSCSVWYGAVIRGDVFHVRIGHNVNIQDMAMIHVTTDRFETCIEDDVTIGHRASLHGCTVRRGALVGMGATVLDEAVVGEGAMVGAGALVTPGTQIEPHTLWTGVPAKFRRLLTPDERAHLTGSAAHYVVIASAYLEDDVGRVKEDALSCTD
jgi:gamma-carbonic anhydrase